MLLEAILKDFDEFALNTYNDIIADGVDDVDFATKIIFGEQDITNAIKQRFPFEQFKSECAAELRQAYAEARLTETRSLIKLALGLIRK